MDTLEDVLKQWFPGEKPDPLGDAFGSKYRPNVLTHNMPLMDVRYALTISFAYVVVIFVLMGIMKMKQQPFELFYFRVIHNAFLVLVSGYLTVGIASEALQNNYSLFCNDGISPDADRPMAFLIWVFYVSKIYEFLDTVIMALRKKFDQITVLHVYHHFSIFLIWWLNLYYFPYGDAYFAPMYNAFVHVLMYSYYLLTSFGIPCPWKPFITKFQIGQFVFFVVQGGFQLLSPGCLDHIFELSLINFLYAISLLILFVHFYVKTYMTKKPRSHKKRD